MKGCGPNAAIVQLEQLAGPRDPPPQYLTATPHTCAKGLGTNGQADNTSWFPEATKHYFSRLATLPKSSAGGRHGEHLENTNSRSIDGVKPASPASGERCRAVGRRGRARLPGCVALTLGHAPAIKRRRCQANDFHIWPAGSSRSIPCPHGDCDVLGETADSLAPCAEAYRRNFSTHSTATVIP